MKKQEINWLDMCPCTFKGKEIKPRRFYTIIVKTDDFSLRAFHECMFVAITKNCFKVVSCLERKVMDIPFECLDFLKLEKGEKKKGEEIPATNVVIKFIDYDQKRKQRTGTIESVYIINGRCTIQFNSKNRSLFIGIEDITKVSI